MRKTILLFLFISIAFVIETSQANASREYELQLWHQYTISRKNVVFVKANFISDSDPELKLLIRGSGVIIKKSGEIATNAHLFYASDNNPASTLLIRGGDVSINGKVVADDTVLDKKNFVLRSIEIETWDGKKLPAKLTWIHTEKDLAKITVEYTFGQYAEIKIIDFDRMTVDDLEKLANDIGPILIIIGHPFGALLWHPKQARITNPARKVEEFNLPLIELDAFINPGNSGGGLFTEKGYLIGIPEKTISGSGIGFAIPIKRFCDIDPEACSLPLGEKQPPQVPFSPE